MNTYKIDKSINENIFLSYKHIKYFADFGTIDSSILPFIPPIFKNSYVSTTASSILRKYVRKVRFLHFDPPKVSVSV